MANVRLTKIDLAYLLRQVQIGANYSQLTSPLDPSGVREVSSANNNLVGAFTGIGAGNYVSGANPLGGSTTADTDFLRLFHTDTPGENPQGTTYNTVNANFDLAAFDPMNPATWHGSVNLDASPRLITNLISSSVTDPDSPMYNPAAAAAMAAAADGTGGYDVPVGNSVFAPSGTTGAFIGDQGVLGGATFNEFFVAFGQFFDHGLDFISKGGGFVAIPLSPSDPLYVDPLSPEYVPGASNIMYLNRASLSNPPSDFDGSGNLLPGVTPLYNNNTGFMIDQSQTYGSHASVNALLRQYDEQGRATGFLITSAEDGHVTTFNGTTYGDIDLSLPTNSDAATKAAHNMATWADFVFNAQRIGVLLTDADSQDIPALRVDATGKLEFDSSAVLDGANQRVYYLTGETLADMVTRTGVDLATLEAHDPYQRDGAGNVLHSNQTMFADMAQGTSTGSTDPEVRDALLAIHYVSGDGRTNENVGLTAVHNIFHEEHNQQTSNVMNSVLTEAANMLATGSTEAEVAAYINDWTRSTGTTDSLATDSFNYVDADGVAHVLTGVAGIHMDGANDVAWDGDYVFQAGRLITESEYNHIAINDYVRSLAVLLPEFVSYSTDVHPNISLEFSQAIFRLGHSMLTEQLQVAVADVHGTLPGEDGYIETFSTSLDLFDAFLNPGLYESTGGSAITLGLLRQQANQIDEFVTPALQQTLVGAPLDLAALNIARGRDVGLPTLNELRQQVYEGLQASGASNSGAALAPYTSWQDFGAHLRTAESLVNFIAAYGRDDGAYDWGLDEARAAYQNGDINTATGELWTLRDIRGIAQAILDAYSNSSDPHHDDAATFMEGAPSYNEGTGQWEFSAGDQGFWDIDLWLGGLAEMPTFDGPLGTTFSYIMLDFGQRLMDGDRFYYLYRMPVGHHLGDELLSHTFSEMIERTTGLEYTGAAFGNQTGRFILDGTGELSNIDSNSNINDFFNASQHFLADGVTPANEGHIIVAGLDGNDYIIGGVGDDYLYGDAGNDTIQGGQGNDNIFGGAGDDWIYDDENDDTINGGAGNDHIFAGPGILDVIHGALGDDEVHGGTGIDEVYGDDGNDALFGEGDTDLMMGGEGNDYMNGGDGVDEMFGGNGNDWLQGDVGDDNLNGGSGNDLLEGGLGAVANDGDRLNGDSPVGVGTTIIEWNGDGTEGDMDIGSYEDANIAITANMQTSNVNGSGSNLMDTYAFLEGLVGSRFNDNLTGADENTTTSNGPNNYLIGGGGDDTLTGLGGNDFIFGDSANVDNALHSSLDETRYFATGSHSAASPIGDWVTQFGELRPVFADGSMGHVLGDSGTPGGHDTAVFQGNMNEYTIIAFEYTDEIDGSIHPALWLSDNLGRDGEDVVVDVENFRFANGDYAYSVFLPPEVSIGDRTLAEGTGAGTTAFNFTVTLDHAFFHDVTITYSTSNGTAAAPGDYAALTTQTITIPAGQTTGTITVNVNQDIAFELDETFTVNLLSVSEGTIGDGSGLGTILNDDAANTPPTLDLHAFDVANQTYVETFNTQSFTGNDNTGSLNWSTAWSETNDGTNTATGGQIRFVGNSGGVLELRDSSATVTTLGNGATVARVVDLSGAAAGTATLRFDYDESSFDNGEHVSVQFSRDGAVGNFVEVMDINGSSGNGTANLALTGAYTSGATLRFVVYGTNNSGDNVRIDNVTFGYQTQTAAADGNTYAVSYTEPNGTNNTNNAVSIALNPSITDPDGTTLTSATIVLTDAVIGDIIGRAGALPAGITGIASSSATVAGPMTITLTGTASLAAYQTAIAQYRFYSSSDNPTAATRHVDVTVNDGSDNSNVSHTVITVNPTNEAPSANNDTLIINSTASITLPDSIFLGNDTDPENAALTITNVNNSNGLATNASHSVPNSTITFADNTNAGGTFSYTASDGSLTNSANVTVQRQSGSTINGNNGADIIAVTGNVNVNAGNGNDTIVVGATAGRQVINGGQGNDTFVLLGTNAHETFNIYAMSGGQNSGLAASLGTTFAATTGIVVTRTVGATTTVVAELNNVEEIRINGNTQAGTLANGNAYTGSTSGDSVNVIGNFVGTGLAYNTITVNGANSTVDITQLTSAHRVVLNGGGSSVIGDLRPQDIVNGLGGAAQVDDIAATLVQPAALTGFGTGLAMLGGQSTSGFDLGIIDRDSGVMIGTPSSFHRVYELDINSNLDLFDTVHDRGHHFWA